MLVASVVLALAVQATAVAQRAAKVTVVVVAPLKAEIAPHSSVLQVAIEPAEAVGVVSFWIRVPIKLTVVVCDGLPMQVVLEPVQVLLTPITNS
jgi:hypothetical protein